MTITTVVRDTLKSRVTLLGVMLAALAYTGIAGGVLKEFNPLEWLNAPGRNYLHEQLNDEAMRLADRNGNGYLEPSELEELFRRAGREPPRFKIETYGLGERYSASAYATVTREDNLHAGDLEAAIASYRAEQGY